MEMSGKHDPIACGFASAKPGLVLEDNRHMARSNTSRLLLMALCLALACVAVPVVVLAG
jgi:hypothetical protein